MCFSSTISFGAGIALAGIGVSCIRQTEQRTQRPFATIPIFFAIQQISEGFLWLAFKDQNWLFLKTPMTYLFLFFAQVLWPFWVPYAIFQLEPNHKRRWKFERILLVLGLLVSVYFGYCLLLFDVEAKVIGKHIVYMQNYPEHLRPYIGGIYFVAIILPPFFSGIKRMWTLGAAIVVSCLVTAIFYREYLVSVWCFFAALISGTILAILYDIKRLHPPGFDVAHSRT